MESQTIKMRESWEVTAYCSWIFKENNSNHFNGHFQDNTDRPVPECQTVLDFAAARDDGDDVDNRNS